MNDWLTLCHVSGQQSVLKQATLNSLMGLTRGHWQETRATLQVQTLSAES